MSFSYMSFFYKKPLFPLDKYDGKQPLRGVINGVVCFSDKNYNDYPLTLAAGDTAVAKLSAVDGFGWHIEFFAATPDKHIPPQDVYLETMQPVPLPLGLLGITEMSISGKVYNVSVEGKRLVLTEPEPK